MTHIQQVDTDHGFIVGTDVCDLARVCSCMFFITFNDIRESTLFISLQKGKKKAQTQETNTESEDKLTPALQQDLSTGGEKA